MLLGNGDGSFGARTDFAAGDEPQVGRGRRLQRRRQSGPGDGQPRTPTPSASFSANGSGGFAAKTDFATGDNPLTVAVADFDRDGKPDLMTADNAADTASVRLNTTPQRIRSLKPTRARVGATVTIVGWGFGRTRGASKVFIGKSAAW